MITRPSPIAVAVALTLLLASGSLAHAESSALPPDVRVGETYLVVIGPSPTSMTIEALDTASGWALVSSERPEIDGGRVNLGQALMIRADPR